jgi:predicted nucleic acid-binding protein
VSQYVVDASVALKWFIAEPDSADAVNLRRAERLLAPDLIVPEVGNALWKAARRGELSADEVAVAARLMEQSDVELRPMRALLRPAMSLALALDHPVYDCVYLALAAEQDCALVTADEQLIRKMAGPSSPNLGVLSPATAAEQLRRPN